MVNIRKKRPAIFKRNELATGFPQRTVLFKVGVLSLSLQRAGSP